MIVSSSIRLLVLFDIQRLSHGCFRIGPYIMWLYVLLVLFLLPFVVILVTLSFHNHNCRFSKSVCLLSILFLVTVCFLPSVANKRHHYQARALISARGVGSTGINAAGDAGDTSPPICCLGGDVNGNIPTNTITYVRIQQTNISRPRPLTAFSGVFYLLFCSKIPNLPQNRPKSH